jgi:phosphatidylserine decarboxylase
MTLHKEGKTIIALTGISFAAILCILIFTAPIWILATACVVFAAVYGMVLWFFRVPKRTPVLNEKEVLCPADGKVVVIEEAVETEWFNDKRIQVSIFMSPLNVHQNRVPVSGKVIYSRHHHGKYLVAWHPKSSTENERTTVVFETSSGVQLLARQIAGAMARRIVCYMDEGKTVKQGDEFGFIKFGSRVDLFLPLTAKVHVKIGDKVTSNITQIASLE